MIGKLLAAPVRLLNAPMRAAEVEEACDGESGRA